MLVSELPALRDHWYPVTTSEALSGGPQAVRLFGEDHAVWRTAAGTPVATTPFCPHRSAALAGGWVDGDTLVCPYHGWRFDERGACVHIPQLDPGLPTPPKARVTTFPVEERYGVVWMCVGEPPGPVPRWPEGEDPTWRTFVEFFEVWHVAAPRIIDNTLDQSHPAFVHRTTFGDPDRAQLPDFGIEPTPGGFVARIAQEVPGVGAQLGTGDEQTYHRRVAELELLAPLTTRLHLWFEDGHDYSFFGCATPVDDQTSIYMRLTALQGPEEEQPWAAFNAFGKRVKEEDRVVLETTLPDLPLDITAEVHLRCDRLTLQYRKHLARLAAAGPVAAR